MKLTVLCLGSLLFGLALSGPGDRTDVRTESEAHQMFSLRDSLSKRPQASAFYAGEVACAFNDTTICEVRFKEVLAVEPRSTTAKQIHHILAYAALREGRYERSLHEFDAVLAIDPNDRDAETTRPVIKALSKFPDQVVEGGGPDKVTVQMDGGRLPLAINGRKAAYSFDTGANLSTISESEASRLGMDTIEVGSDALSTDINGNKVLFRVALAKSLALGNIKLSNVVFLVSSNEQQPFVGMPPGQRGLIGLPVLRAFGSITWTRGGSFESDRSPVAKNLAAATLCFDDMSLITEVRFEQNKLPFILDTGAETTYLWPKFAPLAAGLIRSSGRHEVLTVTGMGGAQKLESTLVPKIILQLGGKSVSLDPAHILRTQQREDSGWFYGNIGIDLVRQVQNVCIDFRRMTLRLDATAN